jgi:hypothetical protein
MGELKPIGSEKLTGNDKLKRILELTYYQTKDSASNSSNTVAETKTGVYGIVKEKDGYYVKKGPDQKSLDYIGGMFMKNKNRFPSYGEAYKKLKFLAEQENVIEEGTKYVLNTKSTKAQETPPAPQAEAPVSAPTNDPTPPPPVPDNAPAPGASSELTPGDLGGNEGNEGDEDDDNAPENEDDYLKIIQAKTGKLTQKLSKFKDKLKSEDIKYVLSMVLGAVDIHKLEESDKEELLKKFENDEGGESGLNPENNGQNPEKGPDFEAAEMMNPENEQLGELDRVDNADELHNDLSLSYHNEDEDKELEELINTPFEFGDEEPYDPEEDEVPSEPLDLGKDAAKAAKFAKKDIAAENPDFDFNQEFEKARNIKKKSEEECSGNVGSEITEEDPTIANDVRELDINELQNAVASGVKETLSKYFEQ